MHELLHHHCKQNIKPISHIPTGPIMTSSNRPLDPVVTPTGVARFLAQPYFLNNQGLLQGVQLKRGPYFNISN
jgi:hypothetical protein